jgi:hypothetical protein
MQLNKFKKLSNKAIDMCFYKFNIIMVDFVSFF